MKKNYTIRLVIGVAFIVLLILLRALKVDEYLKWDFIKENAEYFSAMIADHYLFSSLIFIASYIVIVYLCIPITQFLNIGAGFFFGMLPATLFCVVSASIGALTSFFTFRYLIGEYASQRYSGLLKSFNDKFKKHGAGYLLSLQFFPLTPFSLINILAGLSTLSWWTFVWTTAIGIIPGTLVYTYAGSQLSSIGSVEDLLSPQIITALLLLVVLSLMPIVLRRLKIIN